MFGEHFEMNESTLPVVEEIGRHIPGGFLIHRADGDEDILYANQAVFNIFGCKDEEEFRALTGYTFKGMLLPDDYEQVTDSMVKQESLGEDNTDYETYRIICKDGKVRWVDDHSHYTQTKYYGGIYYVFISDITDKREAMEKDLEVRNAVIKALGESYHTMWLITDVEHESFSLYRGDTSADSPHADQIRNALGEMKYSQAKEYYINTTVAPFDRERLQEELTMDNIVKRLEEKPQFNVNYLRMMDDGSERYFRIEFAKVSMPNGRMGVVCGFKDVDDDVQEQKAIQRALEEGKKAEEENRRLIEEIESAAKLADLMGSVASLLTNMPAMSFSKDAETGVYLACNQSFAEYAHKDTPDGVVGLTDHQIFDCETADHFVEDDQMAISMDKPYVFVEDVPDAAGNPRSFQTTKMKFRDADGRLCTIGMCVDITEMTRMKTAEAEARIKQQALEQRIELQEQLLEEEARRTQQSQMITALSSDYWSVYYLELDKDDGICYQSHADIDDGFKVGDRFKYLESVTAYANRYITDQYREEFMKFIQPEAIKEGLKKQRVISYTYMVSRHGRESYEAVRFAGVRHPEDRDDHMVHAVGACFADVDTETRRSLQQSELLTEALSNAEQASRAKTAFLSNMSHEIRTPMNAIIGLNNIALNDPNLADSTREHLEKIGDSAKHLLNIINDILDMSRIESGKMTIKNEEFCFSKTLEQINTMISGQCRDRGLEYDCRMKGNIADYYIGDDMKLRQILINILSNAVKFTEPGGRVSFMIEEITRFNKNATLKFTIEDSGIGMSQDYLPHLFDAFSQEDSSATNKYGSTGLGMPITKNIVELMNGHIEVESEKGVGSRFTVTLTLSESGRKHDVIPEGEFHPHDLSVLVIDDDPVACEHAKIVLEQVNVRCDIAASGAEGVDLVTVRHARRDPYDLILVDWKMPEMDGVETTRKIRSIIGHDSAIIILTSYNWDDIVEEAHEAGVDSFVPKPLFAASVMDEFREAFRLKQANRDSQDIDLKGRRVLLAEDMVVNAEIMVMVLGMRELDVEVAENGKIAVDMFMSHPEGYYDVILMDVRMPEMDGLEATRVIRSSGRSDAASIPIIALTANAFDEDVQRSMQAGLNAHLSKPVEPESLFETIANLIRK
ncbi:MAG: response regulator [Clostridiales bacterium]|nr:response regulator [Clostridiales bacterium]